MRGTLGHHRGAVKDSMIDELMNQASP